VTSWALVDARFSLSALRRRHGMVIFGHEFPIVMEFNYNNVSIEICHSENAPRTENHSGGMFLFSGAESGGRGCG
jgi:hypothetical protein